MEKGKGTLANRTSAFILAMFYNKMILYNINVLKLPCVIRHAFTTAGSWEQAAYATSNLLRPALSNSMSLSKSKIFVHSIVCLMRGP